MARKGSGSIGITAPTIDDIDPSLTPSLVGYWKMDDIPDGVAKDYSGNGYDLKPYDTEENLPWDSRPIPDNSQLRYKNPRTGTEFGHLTNRCFYGIPITGTLLDTQGKFVVWGCYGVNDDIIGSSDTDFGTAWAGGHYPTGTPTFSGFNIGAFGILWEVRAVWDEGATQKVLSAAQYGSERFLQPNEEIAIVGAFKPSSSPVANDGVLYGSHVVHRDDGQYRELDDSDTAPSPAGTIPDTLVAQTNGVEPFFGYRSTSTNASPIRDAYVWAFNTEPPYLQETVAWLSRNPGCIPPWWIGK